MKLCSSFHLLLNYPKKRILARCVEIHLQWQDKYIWIITWMVSMIWSGDWKRTSCFPFPFPFLSFPPGCPVPIKTSVEHQVLGMQIYYPHIWDICSTNFVDDCQIFSGKIKIKTWTLWRHRVQIKDKRWDRRYKI